MAKKTSSPEYVKRHMKERIFQERAVRNRRAKIALAEQIGAAAEGWQRWSFQERALILMHWMGMSRQQSLTFYLRPWFQLSLHVRKGVKRFFRVSFQPDHVLHSLRYPQTKEAL
jgi:hypothetical protein